MTSVLAPSERGGGGGVMAEEAGGGAGSLATRERRHAREDRRRQKRIVIFCNGDVFFKGKKLSITPNRYVSYKDLLQDLTYRMPNFLYLPNGVRQLFSPTTGHRVSDIGELRDGGAYVCAGNETFKPVKYGEAELMPWGKGAQASGTASYNDYSLFTGSVAAASSQHVGYNAFPPSKFLKHQLSKQPLEAATPSGNRFAALRAPGPSTIEEASTGTRQPKVVKIIREGTRPRHVVKMLLNRRGVQSYQQLLADISDSFGSQSRRARLRCLWTISGREVRDVADLFRDDEVFVGSTEETIGLDRVADLLDEHCSDLSQATSLIKQWERRLKRQEKRRKPAAAAAAAAAAAVPHRVEELDSGYEEADLLATTPTHRQPAGVGEAASATAASGASTRNDKLRQALEARRHSRPLPLIHDPQPQQATTLPVLDDAGSETARQRHLEEQKLTEEAALAKRDKQRRLNKQRETPAAAAAAGGGSGKDKQARGHVVLPPIQPSAKEPQLPPVKEEKEAAVSGKREKSKSRDKKGHQSQQPADLSQVPLPAMPPQPIPQQQQQQQQQLFYKPAVQAQQPSPRAAAATPDEQQRILSPVREEEKETEKDDREVSIAEARRSGRKQKSGHASPRHGQTQQPHRQQTPKTPKASAREDREPEKQQQPPQQQQQQQQQQQPKRKSAKKPQQQVSQEENPAAATTADSTPRPLIRQISSNRLIKERFELGKMMGDGNFAVVHACTKKGSSNEYAIKIIDKSKLRGKEHMVISEVRIMKLCQHSNIVRLLEEYETHTEIYLVMELVKGGDLFDAISQALKFNEMQSAHMVADMANALFYLHSRNIVHRDLKPENLLVYRSKENKISLKLGDFGLAMEVEKPIYTVCGTPTYVAPEILEERGYGLEVDLWAMGVITYILLCGFPPFRSRDRKQTELFNFIKAGVFEFLSPYWDHVSLSAKDLIQHLLVVDRKRRYTAIDVLCHPWVVTFGGSERPQQGLKMKERQEKLREQLVKQAEEGMAEFVKVKATSIYGNVRQ